MPVICVIAQNSYIRGIFFLNKDYYAEALSVDMFHNLKK